MISRIVSFAFLMLLSWTAAAVAAPRNVVLFVTDDQGKDAGCYGNPVIQTPNLDALAADGTVYDHAYATTASCSASRSVILTGIFNHANGHYGHEHSYHHFRSYDNVKSLPVYLEAAGYRTARIGKYHVAPEEVYHFQHALKGNSRNAVEMANNSADFIGEDSDKPFFLYICTSDPHRGGGVVESDPYKPDAFGNKPKGYPGVETVTYDPNDVIVPSFLPDTPTCRAELAQYYQSVSRIDQGLGRLVEILKEKGVYDDTLILYISDHGIAFPGGKTTTYEPGLNSPCIVRNPYNKKRGLRCEAMVSWVDLTPTIVDFANATPKKNKMQGRSFLKTLDQENPAGWDEIYASHTFHEITMYYPMRVVRSGNYKLIWNIAHGLPYPFASDLWAAPTFQDIYKQGPDAYYGQRTVKDYIHRPAFELFDLSSDPYESHNLADVEKYSDVKKEMQEKLKAFQKRTADPWISKWDYE
ncbi:sulfatase [Blastopirellula sp. J2-11]|uniref:sulfatase family protein n=1 Tax=Blastopirellula sp. J2-11 TaxID=2943192 RepID=UPI0021C6F471|nr:sulfatase [Blastopirellula sp. J2-11]UUO07260.1 sulfatase [Blastopirellula sp. J2-11]